MKYKKKNQNIFIIWEFIDTFSIIIRLTFVLSIIVYLIIYVVGVLK